MIKGAFSYLSMKRKPDIVVEIDDGSKISTEVTFPKDRMNKKFECKYWITLN